MARSRSSKSGKGIAKKKQGIVGRIKSGISRNTGSGRVGSGGRQRSRNIMRDVDKMQ